MTATAGIILAGGQSRRMGGGDKCLLSVDDAPLLRLVADRLGPQVAVMAINANGDPGRFAAFALPVLADVVAGQPGPLAGILTALLWARDQGLRRCLTVAGDTPLLPMDLLERLEQAVTPDQPAAIAASGGRVHPVCGLWPVSLIAPLRQALAEGRRGVWKFAQEANAAQVSWSDQPADPFLNVNTPEDLAALRNSLRRR